MFLKEQSETNQKVGGLDNQCQDVNPWMIKVDSTKQPVIGILSQTYIYHSKNDTRFDNFTSYIGGTYVRMLESAGAQVIPILWDDDEEVIKYKLTKVNGVLLPGGGGNYLRAGQLVLEEAQKKNDNHQFFPLWGICLGMERLISYTAAEPLKTIENYGAYHLSLPIEFVGEPSQTGMFCPFGYDKPAELFTQGNYTYNAHNWSVPVDIMSSDIKLKEFWKVTSITNKTMSGADKDFVSSMEANDYPFIATQFHPEKSAQAWNDVKYGVNHSWEAIQLNRVFAQNFVAMARANTNFFDSFEQVNKELIQNYQLIQTDYSAGDIYVFE